MPHFTMRQRLVHLRAQRHSARLWAMDLETRNAAALALHQPARRSDPAFIYGTCLECSSLGNPYEGVDYPCPTALALGVTA